MHPQERAFLDAIIADPADDTPRLVFADWLSDNKQEERGEFIRLQCLIHNAPLEDHNADVGYRQWEQIKDRVQQLLDKTPNWSGWTHEAFDSMAYDVGVATDGEAQIVHLYDDRRNQIGEFRCTFSRGFVSHVTLSLADFREHAAALFRAAPIERVTLSDRVAEMHEYQRVASYSWWNFGFPDDPATLPEDIFGLLPENGINFETAGRLVWDQRAKADAALSAALVTFGRDAAGLGTPTEAH